MSRIVNAASRPDGDRWVPTRTDIVLWTLPIGLFLSIVWLV